MNPVFHVGSSAFEISTKLAVNGMWHNDVDKCFAIACAIITVIIMTMMMMME